MTPPALLVMVLGPPCTNTPVEVLVCLMLMMLPELITVRSVPWPIETALPELSPVITPVAVLVTEPPNCSSTRSPPETTCVMVPELVTTPGPTPGLPPLGNLPMLMALLDALMVAPSSLTTVPPPTSVMALPPASRPELVTLDPAPSSLICPLMLPWLPRVQVPVPLTVGPPRVLLTETPDRMSTVVPA